MATGGHKKFDGTESASEDAPELTCSRCQDNGNASAATSAATAYCQDCNQGYCKPCQEIHASFPGMKNHQFTTIHVTRRRASRGGVTESPTRGSSQTLACPDHEGQTLSIFCGDHGAVCCPVCVAMNHSICIDKGYIPKMSTGIAGSSEYLDTQRLIDMTLKSTDAVLEKLGEGQDKLNESKELVTENIRDIKRQVIELFDGLEDDALLDVAKHSSTVENKLGVATNIANDVHNQLKTFRESLKPGDNMSEPEMFINMKKCQQNAKDAQSVLNNVSEAANGCELTFAEKPFLQKIRGLSSLGKVDIGN